MTHCPKENSTRNPKSRNAMDAKAVGYVRHTWYIPGSLRFLSARSILSPIEILISTGGLYDTFERSRTGKAERETRESYI
jgi:hypothetical protein